MASRQRRAQPRDSRPISASSGSRNPTSAKKKIRILIADREGIFRFGLKKLFGIEDDLRVVAQAETAEQVLAMAESFKPDLLFVQQEIVLEGNAEQWLASLRRVSPQSKLVITASVVSEADSQRYLQAGAASVILKSLDPRLFLKCARQVAANEVWRAQQPGSPAAPNQQSGPRPLRPVDTLTRREKTIISYLTQGWRNREIAQRLAISEQTVKNHLRSIYDKVGVSDRLELVLYAIHQRLELPPIEAVPVPG
jgi:two-component system nitrate/nitrite response regulator NarL